MWADLSSHSYRTVWKEGALEQIPESFELFELQYRDSFVLPHYFNIRLSESMIKLNARQYKIKLKKILQINKIKGIEKAIEIIEEITRQSKIYLPNDNSYSLFPRKIKYFGKSTNSGLYSYMGSDNMIKSTNWQKAMAWQKEGFVGEE